MLPLPLPRQRCRQPVAAKLPLLLPSCPPPQSCRCRRCAVAAAAALLLRFLKRCCQLQSRASAKLPPLLPSWLLPPRCRCQHCCCRCRCAATATAKLPLLLPPTSLCHRTAAAPLLSPRCCRLRHHAATVTAATMLPWCLPPPCFCRRRPAATVNATLPSTTPLPLF
jgi:hypothetical protein